MILMKKHWLACLATVLAPMAGFATEASFGSSAFAEVNSWSNGGLQTIAAACSATTWQAGVYYRLGDVVQFNGQYYKVVNVGANGSDGTDPTISTWYWQPASCDSGGGGNSGGGSCSNVNWQAGVYYRLGDVVKYNGSYYKVVNVGANGSDGTDPTISTWYWQPAGCEGGGDGTPTPTPTPTPNPGNGGGNGSFAISEAQYNSMFPGRNPLYTYSALVNALSAYPSFAHTGDDTTQKQEIAAFLANIAHESDNLRATREYNQANWPGYCSGDCAPGQQYYGRGPIQLSWNSNYRAAGQAIGVDLWSNPDLVATDGTIAWKTAIWYWMTGTGNAGVTPHTAITSGQGFGTTIRAINGSLECNGGRPDQVQTRVNYYLQFTGILGVAQGGNLTC